MLTTHLNRCEDALRAPAIAKYVRPIVRDRSSMSRYLDDGCTCVKWLAGQLLEQATEDPW